MNLYLLREYQLDIILSCTTIFCVCLYIITFTTTYPSSFPNITLQSTKQETIHLYDISKEETLLQLSYSASADIVRNNQHLQRFAFTNKDVKIIDISLSQELSLQNQKSFPKDFQTYHSNDIPNVFIQKLPVLFYLNDKGIILSFQQGSLEYADLLQMTSRDK